MPQTKMTAEEYYPAADLDPRRTELIDGEYVVVTPEPRMEHGALQIRLGGAIDHWSYEGGHGLLVSGPSDIEVGPFDVYGPDVFVTPPAPAMTERGMLDGLPLIVVEVRSPSTWHRDTGRKKTMYERSGIPELWLVDGFSSSIVVFRRSSPDEPSFDVTFELARADTLTSPQLPGFALALVDLFREG